jgi:hypothetical protein
VKDADKALMDGLGLVTDLREDEWALVVSEVKKAGGVRECSGHARVEVERAVAKARTLVAKHPGHANQASHGGKGGGAPAGSPASPAGGAGGSTAGDAGVAQAGKILSNAKDGAMYHDAGSIAQEKAMMGKATKSDAIGRAHKHDQDFAVSMKDSNAYAERATAVRRAQPNNPKAEKMAQALDRDSRKFQTEAAISMSLASAWSSVAMDLGASESDLISNNRL